MLLYMHLQHFK